MRSSVWKRKAVLAAPSWTAAAARGRTPCTSPVRATRYGASTAPQRHQQGNVEGRGPGIATKFLLADALDLSGLGRTFESIIDCGLFHVFSDQDRVRYVASLSAVTKPGTRLVLLCFSDLQPGDYGPRRISKAEIGQAFEKGWRVQDIRAAAFETNMGFDPVKAWLSEIVRFP